MPRKLRVEYEGAIYHVMNRGDRREAIFLDDEDREQACGWKEMELSRRPKGDKRKVRMAAWLREETTMAWAWIAGRWRWGIGVPP